MGSNEEVCQNAPRAKTFPPSASGGIILKGTSRCSPDILLEVPIDKNSSVIEEEIEKGFVSRRKREQLGIDGRSDD